MEKTTTNTNANNATFTFNGVEYTQEQVEAIFGMGLNAMQQQMAAQQQPVQQQVVTDDRKDKFKTFVKKGTMVLGGTAAAAGAFYLVKGAINKCGNKPATAGVDYEPAAYNQSKYDSVVRY